MTQFRNSPTLVEESASYLPDMVTVQVKLAETGHALSVGLPKAEWLKLVSDFVKMPADERQRLGVSIRDAVAASPFPADGEPVTPKLRRQCDTFMNDSLLLAALAETVGKRILLDTVVEDYAILSGMPPMGVAGAVN